jgi:hypothetical protein
MDYTAHQRALIARMGDAARQFRDTVEAQRRAQSIAGRSLIDAVTALTAAIERSNEMTPPFLEYVDAFHEFLDTL